MKNLLICSVNKNFQDSLASYLDGEFNVTCCFPSSDPHDTMQRVKPDICFFDREIISDKDIKFLEDVHQIRKNSYIILAYFYYEATKISEEKISDLVNEVILKPYQFDKLIDKISFLKD